MAKAMSAEREAVPGSVLFECAGSARGRVVAFFSGQGGVGKTTIAVNLAALSAKRGRRAALLTLPPGSPGFLAIAERVASRASGHIEVGVLARPAESWGARVAALVARGASVLLDCGSAPPAELASLAACVDRMVLVTTSDPPALADAYGALKGLTAAGCQQPVGVLVNLVHGSHDAFRAIRRLTDVSRRYLGRAVEDCGFVPHDRRIQLATRQMAAVVEQFPTGLAGRRLAALHQRLLGPEIRVFAGRPSLWPSLAGLFL